MILLDTNIVIYLHGGQLNEALASRLRNTSLDTCNIIVSEVLGYESLSLEDATYFKVLFAAMKNHLFDNEVTATLIELRRTTSLKLPDAIIAATALVNDLELWTHNTADFRSVPQLRLFDPIIA